MCSNNLLFNEDNTTRVYGKRVSHTDQACADARSTRAGFHSVPYMVGSTMRLFVECAVGQPVILFIREDYYKAHRELLSEHGLRRGQNYMASAEAAYEWIAKNCAEGDAKRRMLERYL